MKIGESQFYRGLRVVGLVFFTFLTLFPLYTIVTTSIKPLQDVQAAFRCLTRFGGQIDPKVAETLDSRIHVCWINPGAQPQAAAAASPAPATAGNATPAPAASRSPAPSANPAPPAK